MFKKNFFPSMKLIRLAFCIKPYFQLFAYYKKKWKKENKNVMIIKLYAKHFLNDEEDWKFKTDENPKTFI